MGMPPSWNTMCIGCQGWSISEATELVLGVSGAEKRTIYQRRAWTRVGRSIVICAGHQVGHIGERHWRGAIVGALLQVQVVHLCWSRQLL